MLARTKSNRWQLCPKDRLRQRNATRTELETPSLELGTSGLELRTPSRELEVGAEGKEIGCGMGERGSDSEPTNQLTLNKGDSDETDLSGSNL